MGRLGSPSARRAGSGSANRALWLGSGTRRMGANLRREHGGEVVGAQSEVGGGLGAAGVPERLDARWGLIWLCPAPETDDVVGGAIGRHHGWQGGLSHRTA